MPKHVAFIMDGNRRWAKLKNKPIFFGHFEGAKRIKDIILTSIENDIENVSFFAFSIENWSRDKNECDYLLGLLMKYMNSSRTKNFIINNEIRFRWLGFDDEKIDRKIICAIRELEDISKSNSKINITIAFNYGGKQEIDYSITTKTPLLSSFLPEIDLLIRTGNEHRISNFILHKLAYSEICFSPYLWPEYDAVKYKNDIKNFNSKDRRYGK